SVPYELDANGTVEPIRSVDVLPQVNGTILHVDFAEGDEVAAGQVLFEIDPRPYGAALQQAEGKLLGDLTTATSAAREAARYRELATTNTVTQEDYEQKQAAADAAAAAACFCSAAAVVAIINVDANVGDPTSGGSGGRIILEGDIIHAGSEGVVLLELH